MSFNINQILEAESYDGEDYFNILGCNEASSSEQIIAEYKIRALKCHPDKNPGDEKALKQFQALKEAKDILTEPELRSKYDRWRGSQICIPFKKWLSMNDRCAATMHWAKPKQQTMIENSSPLLHEASTAATPSSRVGKSYDDAVKIGSNWESDRSSSVYNEFRSYKI